jgi:hypothetical protein
METGLTHEQSKDSGEKYKSRIKAAIHQTARGLFDHRSMKVALSV